ncbi:MAG: hypothetical protein ACK4N5_12305 [Myxococcales bacterium]
MLPQGPILRADASGAIRNAAATCRGFALVPAVELGADADAMPGCFPVRVKPRAGGEALIVSSSAPLFMGSALERGFDLEGCRPGDSWQILTFEDRAAGVLPAPKTQRLVRLASPAAVGVAAPVGEVGQLVRPHYRSWVFYFSGALGAAKLWARSAGGVWYAAEDLSPVDEPVISRVVLAGGGRIAIVAAAPGMNVEIDVNVEVG